MKYKSLFTKTLFVGALLCLNSNIFSQLSPMVIGTINAGDSVVIYYDVTINTGAGASVTNQGTISGSNFTSLVTDDPKTGAANDPTVTQLNVFPLPVRLLELRAAPGTGAIEVSWNVSNEENMIKYEVEKSTDGRTFTKIGDVTALNSPIAIHYSFIDQNPNSGVNYYRLRIIDQATAKYSIIVRVDMSGNNSSIRLFPNPVIQQTFTLQLSNMQKGNYELLVYNNIGQVAYRRTIVHDGGSSSKNITLPASLSGGVYHAQLKADRALHSQMLIVQ